MRLRLLLSNVFVPQFFATKERGVDDLHRAGVESCGRVRRIELGFQVVVKIEEFFAKAILGFERVVIRGFGGDFRCYRIFVGDLFLLDFFDASRRTFFVLNFKRSEEARLLSDADQKVVRNAK